MHVSLDSRLLLLVYPLNCFCAACDSPIASAKKPKALIKKTEAQSPKPAPKKLSTKYVVLILIVFAVTQSFV